MAILPYRILDRKRAGFSLTEEEIGAIEEHRFRPLDHLYWRSAELDFTDVRALLCPTIDDVFAKLRAAVAKAAPGAWVPAKGFDPSLTTGNAAGLGPNFDQSQNATFLIASTPFSAVTVRNPSFSK